MTIIVISDIYHQKVIGATINSIPTIIDFLIEYDDIDDSYWIPVTDSLNCAPIGSILGKDWKNTLKHMSLEELNSFFKGIYYFETMLVYGSNE